MSEVTIRPDGDFSQLKELQETDSNYPNPVGEESLKKAFDRFAETQEAEIQVQSKAHFYEYCVISIHKLRSWL